MSNQATMPTAVEQAELSAMLQAEVVALRQVQAILPMIADQEMREQMEACIQTGKTHLHSLLAYSHTHHLI